MDFEFRRATSEDLDACTYVRGHTNDNALSREQLEAIGGTNESWTPPVDEGLYTGFVVESEGDIVGFAFGDSTSGEVLVVAVLAGFENLGLGRRLLDLVCNELFTQGHTRLWLAASATPVVRAYGFYRRLGWHPTGQLNEDGDEILTLAKA